MFHVFPVRVRVEQNVVELRVSCCTPYRLFVNRNLIRESHIKCLVLVDPSLPCHLFGFASGTASGASGAAPAAWAAPAPPVERPRPDEETPRIAPQMGRSVRCCEGLMTNSPKTGLT